MEIEMDYGEGKLRFLKEFGVVLCVKCRCCVAPGVVKGHFRDGKLHLGVKRKGIDEIVAWMGGLDGLAMRVEDVKYPKPECVGVDGLEVFLGGCVCRWKMKKRVGEGDGEEDGKESGEEDGGENGEEDGGENGEENGGENGGEDGGENGGEDGREDEEEREERCCRFVCGSDRRMRDHGRTAHGWVSDVGKGRVGRDVVREEKFWERGVKFQRFFKLSSWNVSFEVRRKREGVLGEEDEDEDESKNENENEVGGTGWSERLERMMLEKKDENWKMLRDGRVDGEVGRVDVDNWLKMSGWKDILTGVRSENAKVWLRSVDVDGGEEEEVLEVCESFVGRLVRTMMVVVRSKEMDGQCLKLLNRREVGGEGDGKKMYVGHLVSTLDWYAKV
jgi:hypothetical protein